MAPKSTILKQTSKVAVFQVDIFFQNLDKKTNDNEPNSTETQYHE